MKKEINKLIIEKELITIDIFVDTIKKEQKGIESEIQFVTYQKD